MPEYIRVDNFGGVPLFYDRAEPQNYGVVGTPMRPYVEVEFAKKTDQMFTHLFAELAAANIGMVQAIFSGGVSRAPGKGSGFSYHHTNRAFDLDALIFDNQSKWVADQFPQDPYLYLGIEAVVRTYFGTVLTYVYNSDHEDHIHFDAGSRPSFQSMSKSRVSFLQNSLKFVFDFGISVDGVYGPETKHTADAARRTLGIGGFSKQENWLEFLRLVGQAALDRASRTITVRENLGV